MRLVPLRHREEILLHFLLLFPIQALSALLFPERAGCLYKLHLP